MWRGWAFPVINQVESSDNESFNSVESAAADDGVEQLVSPRRPPQSPSASPRALLLPDPLPVEEVLSSASNRLSELPQNVARRQRFEHSRSQSRLAAEVAVNLLMTTEGCNFLHEWPRMESIQF